MAFIIAYLIVGLLLDVYSMSIIADREPEAFKERIRTWEWWLAIVLFVLVWPLSMYLGYQELHQEDT